jgi:uncharacterized repeat protein (TIGR04076 family)
MQEHSVAITVEQVQGKGICPLGLKKGDRFEMDYRTPAGFCCWALQAILPFVAVVRFDGELPWEEKGSARACCPDPDNPVVFRIERA